MKHLTAIFCALVFLLGFSSAQTVNSNFYPAQEGQDIGRQGQRWDGFFRNMEINGTLSGNFHLQNRGQYFDLMNNQAVAFPDSSHSRFFMDPNNRFTCENNTGILCTAQFAFYAGQESTGPITLPMVGTQIGYFKAGVGFCSKDATGTEYCPGSGGGGGSASFSAITSGTNSAANMFVDTGSTLLPSGTGQISSTGNLLSSNGMFTPSPLASTLCPTGEAPWMYGKNASGNYEPLASWNTGGNPPTPSGSITWCWPMSYNDSGTTLHPNRAFSVLHYAGNGGLTDNGSFDDSAVMGLLYNLGTQQDFHQLLTFYGENLLTGNPTFHGHAGAEDSVAVYRGNFTDNRSSTSGGGSNMFVFGGQLEKQTTGQVPTGYGVFNGIFSNEAAGDQGGRTVSVYSGQCDDSNGTDSNFACAVLLASPPTNRFPGGTPGLANMGLEIGAFGTAAQDFNIWSAGTTTTGFNAFNGPSSFGTSAHAASGFQLDILGTTKMKAAAGANNLCFFGSTSGSTCFAAAAAAGSAVFTWPTADGLNGYSLVTDGAGHLSFSNISGGGGGCSGSCITTVNSQTGPVLTLNTSNTTNINMSVNSAANVITYSASLAGLIPSGNLNANTPQSCSTTGIPLTCAISTQNLSIGIGAGSTWGASSLNANVPQTYVNDTNVTLSMLGQQLTAGWQSTLGVPRGGLNLSAIAVDQIPVGSASNVYTARTLPNGILQYSTATHLFSAASALTNPMTTLGDIIYSSDGSGTAARLAAPTSPDGVAYSLTSTSSGGVGAAPAWGLPGVGGRSVSGASDTVLATDRVRCITYTGSSATAITLGSAASFGSNMAFCVQVTGTVGGTGATLTTSTSHFQPENSSTFVILQGENCTFRSYDNTDWYHTCSPGQQSVGSNHLTLTRSQFGVQIDGDANTITSASTMTANAIALGNGTKTVTPLGSLGTTTTLLHGNASGAPSYGAVALGTDISGTLPIANNCPGATGASSSTFLRGDCTWATPAGGGTFTGPGSAVADNLVSFNGTSGSVGKDSGIASANVVTAASAAGAANQVVLSNGADKTVKYATADSTTTHALFATAGAPAFRAIVAGDIPTLNQNTTGTAANLSGTPALPNGTTATTQSAKDNSTKLATTAYVDAATPLTAGTSVTLSAPRQYFVCTTTCTITVPVPAAGYEFCVMNDDNINTVITLSAIGSSARYENTARSAYGTAGTGTFVSGGAVGDKVCLLGRDSTHYLTTSFNGTWTAN